MAPAPASGNAPCMQDERESPCRAPPAVRKSRRLDGRSIEASGVQAVRAKCPALFPFPRDEVSAPSLAERLIRLVKTARRPLDWNWRFGPGTQDLKAGFHVGIGSSEAYKRFPQTFKYHRLARGVKHIPRWGALERGL